MTAALKAGDRLAWLPIYAKPHDPQMVTLTVTRVTAQKAYVEGPGAWFKTVDRNALDDVGHCAVGTNDTGSVPSIVAVTARHAFDARAAWLNDEVRRLTMLAQRREDEAVAWMDLAQEVTP